MEQNQHQTQLKALCAQLRNRNAIAPETYSRYEVKRGLRNGDGTGVMAGLTRICSVDGYYVKDGERLPSPGRLFYRGYDCNDLITGATQENRFGYEEVVWLLLFGSLPTAAELTGFGRILAESRELPTGFIEDVLMKIPSPDIMNKMAHSVLSLYALDPMADDTGLENVLRQSIELIARMPAIMTCAWQVKRRAYYKKSMYLHPIKPEHATAETVLRTIRPSKQFTPDEARLLDICMILHADHGGGNNSTFASRVLTSSGTDTYSALAAGIGSLKGPLHGGANIQVSRMVQSMQEGIADSTNEGQVFDFLVKILQKKAGDGSGKIYGLGHAVYTLSDPRAQILKQCAQRFAGNSEHAQTLALLASIERLAPEAFAKVKGSSKALCANVDLYSGCIYAMLGIPEDLYTPIFALARMAGWCAHRLEELQTGGRIIRPAYKSVAAQNQYVPLQTRQAHPKGENT